MKSPRISQRWHSQSPKCKSVLFLTQDYLFMTLRRSKSLFHGCMWLSEILIPEINRCTNFSTLFCFWSPCVLFLDMHAWLTTLRLRPSFLPRTHRAPQCYQMSRTGHDLVTLLPQVPIIFSNLSCNIIHVGSYLSDVWVQGASCSKREMIIMDFIFFVHRSSWGIFLVSCMRLWHKMLSLNEFYPFGLKARICGGGGWLYFFAKLSYIFPYAIFNVVGFCFVLFINKQEYWTVLPLKPW